MTKTKEEKKAISRRRFIALAGGSIGGLAGYTVAKNTAGGLLEGLVGSMEETGRDFSVVYKFNKGDRSYLDEQIGNLPLEVRKTFYENLEQKSDLYQGAWDYLEALQRQSLKAPGVDAPGVKDTRDAKKGLIKVTKKGIGAIGEFLGIKNKMQEDAEVQAESKYVSPYNELAKLRMSTMERISLLEESMNELAYKVKGTEYNTGRAEEAGYEAIKELILEHDKYFDLLREFKALAPRQILGAEENASYKTAIERAASYKIGAYQPRGFLFRNVGKMFGALVGVGGLWLGSQVGGGMRSAIGGVGETAKLAIKGTVNGGFSGVKGIGKLVGKFKNRGNIKNSGEEKK